MENRDQTVIFLRDFVLPARIGIYPRERAAPQRLRIGVELTLSDAHAVREDDIESTFSYEYVAKEIRRLADIHHDLVETFAQNIAAYALRDPRVSEILVRVEKPDVFPEGPAGVWIRRTRPARE